LRKVPFRENEYQLTKEKVIPLVDGNIIAVGVILGSTYTGDIDDIKEINKFLLKYKKEIGMDIPIYVDAAFGVLFFPFTEPDFEWNFRLEQVKSINIFNHKYGLFYVGMYLIQLRYQGYKNIMEQNIKNVKYL